jgi:hypothetical protein
VSAVDGTSLKIGPLDFTIRIEVASPQPDGTPRKPPLPSPRSKPPRVPLQVRNRLLPATPLQTPHKPINRANQLPLLGRKILDYRADPRKLPH